MKTTMKIAAIAMMGIFLNLNAQSHHFEITKRSSYFQNDSPNQVAYIDFGDVQFWGYMEVTLTGSWNHQNTIGKYTKRYEIGKNVGRLYRATSEVPTSFGLVSSQWKLGEAVLNDHNHLVIPIYHLVSTGNKITINIKGVSTSSFNTEQVKITDPTTINNSEKRDYITLKNQMSVLGKVGVGIVEPHEQLHVDGNGIFQNYSPLLKLRRNTDTGGFIQGIQTQFKDGTPNFYFGNLHSEQWIISKGEYNGSRLLTVKSNGNAALNGKFEAKEIKVTTSPTADFVFEEDYKLPTLKSIEKHIKEKKHLPDIASAKEMEKTGVNVGDFQIQLLQKIEELTLYTIAQEREIKELKKGNSKIDKQQKEINAQKKEIDELKALVQKLLKEKN
ncbi:hypothetical protein [Tenacibaculum sp. C7A-26P2]|uniref:hypothetical protein n=1 Tax=Tenacibaculum sp. C7A-26P2 TaxID=3447504 RepID=UPI003F82CC84